MLLQALYDYSERNNMLENQAFEHRYVRWLVPVDIEGKMLGEGLSDLSTPEDKKGKSFPCSATIRPKQAGGIAEFLADGATALFGLDSDPAKLSKLPAAKRASREKNNNVKQDDYWRQIKEGFEETQSPLLGAMLKWRETYLIGDTSPSFIRWGVKSEGEKEKWWVKTSTGEVALNPGDIFTFSVNSQIVLNDDELRHYWIHLSQKERESLNENSTRGLCLISGERNAPILLSHPKISRVPGTMAMGGYLISFSAIKAGDDCAFSSYGWKKGENATISTRAAESYAAALNELTTSTQRSIRLGPAVLCYWTKHDQEFADFMGEILNKPTEVSVKKFFQRWKAGIDAPLQDGDQFYSLTLSGNSGRVVVRRWLEQPLSDATIHLKQWFDDLRIQEIAAFSPKPNKKKKSSNQEQERQLPFSIFRLACTTIPEPKKLIPETPVRLFAAALEGASLPLVWLKPILHRFHCDLVKRGDQRVNPFNPSRFALIKLILIRNRKGDSFMPEAQLSDTFDKPYNLGRLLAVLENLQDKAHDYKLEGAGVVEKYYSSASAAPVTVFPLLLRLCRHHLKKLEQTIGKGTAYYIERSMEEILSRVKAETPEQPPSFPRVLSLEEQGRFALGFYQQKAYDAAQRKSHADAKSAQIATE